MISIDLQAATKTGRKVLNKVDIEINALIETIDKSQCQFHRNGSEYSAEDAAAHSPRQLTLSAKCATTTDRFI